MPPPRSQVALGMPSSISRDLRSPASTSASTSERAERMPLKTSSSSSPIVESSDGVLSKVCGSLVEPESKRQQWACHGCGQIFHRDATIFVAPSNPLAPSTVANREKLLEGGSQDHYCRPCYSDRFSMGACVACIKPVLGSTKEDGKFVKASGGDLWHGRCWKCVQCGEASAEKVSLGMTGLPTCEECFDQTPARRKHVVEQPPGSPQRRGRRISPVNSSSALSGSASRGGMGATIAELSKKFGKATPPAQDAAKVSPVLGGNECGDGGKSHSRSNSLSGGRMRPLTAQFSGQGFNLAAFQPSTPTLGRSDSRSRSVSPDKRHTNADLECAKCHRGPFDGPEARGLQANMISLARDQLHFHPECFCCSICSRQMNDSTRSFVRLSEAAYAHPKCAPPLPISRPANLAAPTSTAMSRSPSHSTLSDHATHQRETRPSLSRDASPAPLPTSYLSASGVTDDALVPHAPRRFQSSAGAAPPTRSTLLHQRPSAPRSEGNGGGNLASLAVSSGSPSTRNHPGKFGKLGGMNTCGSCSLSVSSLEGIPGPRGMRWHKKCLVCSSKSRGGKLCGKPLDSSARVDEQGQVRCRQCFDCENSRHPLRV